MSLAGLANMLAAGDRGTLDSLPYARTLGLSYAIMGEEVILTMPYAKTLIGSPQPPRLHGGTVAGLMEITSMAQLLHSLRGEDAVPAIKPIDVTVDYLRAGQPVDTFARATIVRLGRRIANVRVEAWQEDAAKPIAASRMNLMLAR
ncbi:MAG: PaaI family thioesterase [Pacificimonas sp.]